MTALQRAVAAWRKQPITLHRMVVGYFLDEAKTSRDWAAEDPKKRDRDLADARAIDTAAKLLRAASRKPAKKTTATILVNDAGRVAKIVRRDSDGCRETRDGWRCSLLPGHSGWHEAWCTDPARLKLAWPKRKQAKNVKR